MCAVNATTQLSRSDGAGTTSTSRSGAGKTPSFDRRAECQPELSSRAILEENPPGGAITCSTEARIETEAEGAETAAGRVEGLPERVTIYEVGPRDGLQNEVGDRGRRGEGRVHPAARRCRADHHRDHQLRPPEVGSPARRRGRVARAARPARAQYGLPVLVPNERGLDRALGGRRTARSRSSPAPPRRSRRRT